MQPDGQCWFQYQGTPSRRCKGKAKLGMLSCFRKKHECKDSMTTEAYLIGGISARNGRNKPFVIDSITNIGGALHFPSTKAVYENTKLPLELASLVGGFANVQLGENNKDRWGGSAFGSCALHGMIYVFGGKNDVDDIDVSSKKVATYSPATDTWDTTSIPRMPGGLVGCTAVAIGSKIYVLGDSYVFEHHRPEPMHVLDTVALTWSTFTRMPPVHNPDICCIDHIIYAFGGQPVDAITGEDTYGDQVYVFNTEATTPVWKLLVDTSSLL